MADPTLEEVAASWAEWAADGIMEEIDDRDIVLVGQEDELREVIVRHLKDIAISNAKRSPGPTTTDMAARSGRPAK